MFFYLSTIISVLIEVEAVCFLKAYESNLESGLIIISLFIVKTQLVGLFGFFLSLNRSFILVNIHGSFFPNFFKIFRILFTHLTNFLTVFLPLFLVHLCICLSTTLWKYKVSLYSQLNIFSAKMK